MMVTSDRAWAYPEPQIVVRVAVNETPLNPLKLVDCEQSGLCGALELSTAINWLAKT